MLKTYENLSRMIGNTPMLEVKHFDTGPCQLFLKLENMNPGGSIKDRIGHYMIKVAEATGKIKPGDTLVEATAGNTGLGLALTASLRGYRLVVVIPDKMSQEKISHVRATGAEIIMTRSDVAKGHPKYYQDLAETIAKARGAYYVNQFANAANPLAHYETTGPEIWQQMDGQLDAVVAGVGTGGHLTGVGRYLKEVAPHVKNILADPEGSILAEYVNTGKMTQKGSWLVEGIGEDYIPSICNINLVDEAITVSDQESFSAARELLKREGVFAGSSSGTVLHAALTYCRRQTTAKRVVTYVYDSGNKYLSKFYDDQWMLAKGFKI